MASTLSTYKQKRDFKATPEPAGRVEKSGEALSFVIQKHAARRLHYDFRLELDGTLKSWAVPKGPSLDPADKRMAVEVEDHPLSYAGFEGIIPPGHFGAGSVIVWDRGTWVPIGDARHGYREGKLKFELHGEKLHGGYTLVRMRQRDDERQTAWLLIKEHDDEARPGSDYDVVEALPDSVLVHEQAPRKARRSAAETASPVAVKKAAGKGKTASHAQPQGDEPVTPKSRKTAPAARADDAAPEARKPATRKSATRKSETGKSATRRAARTEANERPAIDLPEGATPAALPLTLSPQLATLVNDIPAGDDWVYEIKFDGYRLLTRIEGSDVRCFTRNGNDWSHRMPGLVKAIQALGLPDGWLDGEIVVAGTHGVPDFQALQNAFDDQRTARIQYFVFDLPYCAGHDLREVPLQARRDLLVSLIGKPTDGAVRFSAAFDNDPAALLESAREAGLEGLIGKRRDSLYRPQRSADWVKLKVSARQEFVIGGYTDPQGARTGLGALLLGTHDESGELRYAGNVGTGFNEKTLADLRARLDRIESARSPFVDAPDRVGTTKRVKPHWVRPELIAEVSFAQWTDGGHVRQAVFHGLRSDKAPKRITKEVAVAAPQPVAKPARAPATPLPKMRITHAERVIDAKTGATKGELIAFYARVAEVMLPHLKQRPVALLRGPAGVEGQHFFQKHAESHEMPHVQVLDRGLYPEHESLLAIADQAGLLSAAQMNVLEFHTWNATTRAMGRPDRMLFDLDPGDGVAWSQIQEGATLVRAFLQELGLVSFLKTSGGKGLHVVVPLKPQHDWDTVKRFSQTIVQHLAQVIPQRFVAKSGPKNRVGRIFVDYLRNGLGATTVCAWSARARPGLGVSVPVGWNELPQLTGGAHWTIETIEPRLATGNEPWADYAATRQPLTKAMKAMGFKPEAAA